MRPSPSSRRFAITKPSLARISSGRLGSIQRPRRRKRSLTRGRRFAGIDTSWAAAGSLWHPGRRDPTTVMSRLASVIDGVIGVTPPRHPRRDRHRHRGRPVRPDVGERRRSRVSSPVRLAQAQVPGRRQRQRPAEPGHELRDVVWPAGGLEHGGGGADGAVEVDRCPPYGPEHDVLEGVQHLRRADVASVHDHVRPTERVERLGTEQPVRVRDHPHAPVAPAQRGPSDTGANAGSQRGAPFGSSATRSGRRRTR